jgi:sugar phosphate isomerase/epimerase
MLKLYIGNKNYSSWSMRPWVLLTQAGIEFEEIIIALNDIGYGGPLSVEWEDIRMDRVHGGAEAASFVRSLDFPVSGLAFDAAFDKSKR